MHKSLWSGLIRPGFGLHIGLVLVILGGCGDSQLTRESAARAITESEDFVEAREHPFVHRRAFADAEQQGYLHVERSRYRGTEISVRDIGVRAGFIDVLDGGLGSRDRLSVRDPVAVEVTVTGLAPIPYVQGIQEAQFDWRYVAQGTIRRFLVAGGTGAAEFREYDDGWRIENVRIRVDENPIALTSQEKAEARIDAQTELRRREAEARAHAQLVESSKSPSATVGEFQAHAYRGSTGLLPEDSVHIRITDVDVEFAYVLSGVEERYWFGDVRELKAQESSWIWNGVVSAPSVRGLGSKAPAVLFRDTGERDRFLTTLQGAVLEWRRKHPSLVATD